MDGPGDQHASRPLSVKEIDEQATEFQWNPNIPFKYWVRAAETIFTEVRSLRSFPVPSDVLKLEMGSCD